MTDAVISDAKIEARVLSILGSLEKHNEALRPIGIRASGSYQGRGVVDANGRSFRVKQCQTVLAVREALISDTENLVILTPADDRELGLDVLARLARTRVHTLQPWPMLLELFQASDVAPGLLNARGLAEYLVEQKPPAGYPPAVSGKLDEETAWRIVLRNVGFDAARPDLRAILEWSSNAKGIDAYRALPEELGGSLRTWVATAAGEDARLLFEIIDEGFAADLLPLGLVVDVAFRSNDNVAAALRVRLERYTRGRALSKSMGENWSGAASASTLVRLGSGERKFAMQAIDRADGLLKELNAAELARFSALSIAGLNQRFDVFGKALQHSLSGDGTGLTESLLSLEEHQLAGELSDDFFRERVRRAEMAVRLARWLTLPVSSEPTLAGASRDYARGSAYADWAREAMSEGDPVAAVSAAYQQLRDRVRERREDENLHFARQLAIATTESSLGDAIGVEHVLSQVVVPIMREGQRVLLLVMDGMSQAVFHELLLDIQRLGWGELHSEATRWPRPVIAALPSVTEVSRASLFAGRVAQGQSGFERAEFAAHPQLVEVSAAGVSPILFHKPALSDGGTELAKDVRDAIAADNRKVVGVVVNAVDDFLLKGGQTILPTTLASMPIVRSLFYEAERARRVVVLTADHGHVIERGSTYQQAEDAGERYRLSGGSAGAGEILLAGPRVALSGNRVVAAATETIRYSSSKRFGYHGGATPQECVVPLAVLGRDPFGSWREVATQLPPWWEEQAIVPTAVAPSPIKIKPVHPTPVPPVAWIDQLFASEELAAQRALAGRMAPAEEQLRRLLSLLEERNGVALSSVVSQRLNVPEFRVKSILAVVSRILNVEGYPVISLDDAAKTVSLNFELLRAQFGVGK